MIACRTIIGYGAPTKEGTAATHGSPLGKDEVAGARVKLGWPYEPFVVPDPILSTWRRFGARGAAQREEWEHRHAAPPSATSSTAARRERCRRSSIPPSRA